MTIDKSINLTCDERQALLNHGWPWFRSYVPTIIIESRRGKLRTPSCPSVDVAQNLRSACVKLGVGYYDGRTTIGRVQA